MAATDAATAARSSLADVPSGGYRDLTENGISRLESRLTRDVTPLL
jgi:hypothetical protein